MAKLAGRTGMLNLETNDEAGIRSWTLDYTVDTLDTTDFADGAATNAARTFIAGLSQWSGTFEGLKDGAPYALTFDGSALQTIKLEEDGSLNWSGECLITGIHPNVSVDGVVTYTYDFQGTGALTPSGG